MIVQTPK